MPLWTWSHSWAIGKHVCCGCCCSCRCFFFFMCGSSNSVFIDFEGKLCLMSFLCRYSWNMHVFKYIPDARTPHTHIYNLRVHCRASMKLNVNIIRNWRYLTHFLVRFLHFFFFFKFKFFFHISATNTQHVRLQFAYIQYEHEYAAYVNMQKFNKIVFCKWESQQNLN